MLQVRFTMAGSFSKDVPPWCFVNQETISCFMEKSVILSLDISFNEEEFGEFVTPLHNSCVFAFVIAVYIG